MATELFLGLTTCQLSGEPTGLIEFGNGDLYGIIGGIEVGLRPNGGGQPKTDGDWFWDIHEETNTVPWGPFATEASALADAREAIRHFRVRVRL